MLFRSVAKERNIPIRVGVNSGSLEKELVEKYHGVMPIRIAVSGEMHGPELPDTIFLLGREKSIKHIDQVLATL